MASKLETMPDPTPTTVIANVRGAPSDEGAPGLLVQPGAVLVPNPPPALLDRTAELEVVIVTPSALIPSLAVEHLAVDMAELTGVPPSSTLVLHLAHDARNAYTAVGAPEERELIAKVVQSNDGDLWGTLRSLERVSDLPPLSPETLDFLQAHESASHHPPSWEPGPGQFRYFFGWLFGRR